MSLDQATSTQQLLIGGERRGAASGREFAQTFPGTGEEVRAAAAAGGGDARAAVDAAWWAVQGWWEQPREYPI